MTIETNVDREMTGQLERLACGELDEAARAPLLAWLDADPRRWRLCGIAFLEAQAWSATLGDLGQLPIEPPAYSKSLVQPAAGPGSSFGRLTRIAALAASLLAAFALGFSARPTASSGGIPGDLGQAASVHAPPDAIMASLSVQSPLSAAPPATIQIPVVPSASQSAAVSRLDSMPDYVRQQWERRGYQVTSERRYLFAKLPDGQQVAVPVEQFVVNRIPAKVY